MRTTRRIIPFALLSGLLLSCGSEHRLARVRISQPGVREATTDTACKVPEQIAWTDDKGERHIVTRAEKGDHFRGTVRNHRNGQKQAGG